MSRKTSTYSNKRRAQGGRVYVFNAAEWLNAIQRSRAYTAESIPGAAPDIGGTESEADKAALMVHDALQTLLRGDVRGQDHGHVFDVLAHALGVAALRALQIQPERAQNPALPVLAEGTAALQRAIGRWEARGAFGLDGPGREALLAAVEAYTAILRASSPAQMQAASDERLRILAGAQQLGAGEGVAV
ncbi:hypothetical protein P3G55_18935 [Leptospira sp. 96542]|nr:hypothetical protein [Leptospira sp. 96542]